jgi:SMC interacting uncharacterized protein involved in chromosome segregation
MKEQIKKLSQDKNVLFERFNKINIAIEALQDIYSESTCVEADSIIKNLESEKEDLHKTINKIDMAIKALQNLCNHKKENGSSAMKYEGHDSHNDYYKCSICGHEI